MTSLKSRVLVSVVCIPLLLWVVLLAPAGVLQGALMILSAVAAMEMMLCVGLKKSHVLSIVTAVAAAGTVVCGSAFWTMLWAVYMVFAFLYAIIRAGEVKFVQVLAGIFSVIVVPYAFSSLQRI